MNEGPVKYNFTNFLSVVEDIDRRNYFYKKTATLLQRKAEIDNNYAYALELTLNKESFKSNNNKLSSQMLYQKLLSLIQEEPKRIKTMAEELLNQSIKMNQILEIQSSKNKKSFDQAQRISKQILSLKEKLQKLKPRLQRKNSELQQVKIQYLSSLLGSDQLQRKNDLYLQVGKIQSTVKPLQEQYNGLYFKYSQSISIMTDKFNIFLQNIEQIQSKKIMTLKQAVIKYVLLTKANLDNFLQNYPFIREDIDTIREKNDFIGHSQQSLINQGHELKICFTKDSDYISTIYDRIQKKKNLEEIILYGQSVQHKRHLNSTIGDPELSSSTVLTPKIIRMVEIFKAVFQGQPQKDMLCQIQCLMRGDEQIRKDFILCLQKYRIINEFELKLKNKDFIIKCIYKFLNVCADELDTYNSKMLMVLSLTYHFKEGDKKVQLQELISDHQIWKKIGWWQAALLQSIYEETRVKIKKQEIHINIWDIKAGGVSRKEEGQEETHHHICFNQLLYYVRNMNLFHLDPERIWQYAKQNINLLRFTGKAAKDILDLCPRQGSPLLKKNTISSSP